MPNTKIKFIGYFEEVITVSLDANSVCILYRSILLLHYTDFERQSQSFISSKPVLNFVSLRWVEGVSFSLNLPNLSQIVMCLALNFKIICEF